MTAPNRATYYPRWANWLAMSICIWGVLIAAGAYWRYRDFKKAGVILIVALVFAGIWALVGRANRRPNQNAE